MKRPILMETTESVYAAIYNHHSHQFSVFSSYTNIQGGEIFTEWGFNGADYPLMQHRTTWDPENPDEPRKHRYWLVSNQKETE